MIETKEAQRNRDLAATDEEPVENRQTVEGQPDKSRSLKSEAEFAPLFKKEEAEQFRTIWLEIQSGFVDDPNISVKEADELVNNVIKNILFTFADQRTSLESQWKNGDKVSTEDLRLALKQYHSLFNRLLSV